MTTKNKRKEKPGYISEAKGRLIVLAPEVIRQVVDSIPETEDLGLASEVDGRLAIFTPETIREMVNRAQEREEPGYVSEVHGQIKVFTPDIIRGIVDHIQEAETAAPLLGETLWSRKLAAKPFAQELFDAAMKKKQLDKCYAGLNKAAELSEDREAVAFLEDKEVHFLDKVKLLSDKLGDTNYLVMNLIYQLITERTVIMLTDIADEYNRLFNNLNGTVRAQVVTAISLDEEQKLKISQRLGDMTGKKVILEPEIDPDIIGGIIVKIGDKLMDGSIRGKLEAMKKLMAGL